MLRFSPVRPVDQSHPTLDRQSGRIIPRLLVFAAALACAAFLSTAAAHAEIKKVCATATETTAECMSFEISGEAGSFQGGGEKGGFTPAELRSAYKLPEKGGKEQTIVIVDAFNDPNAEADLKTYRSHYGLPECTTGCFKKVNQEGKAESYPANSASWSVEMSLDLDDASAICPECHLTLVEATSNSYSNMDAAENTAASLTGTTVISDSWGGPERSTETSEDKYFEHPGIPIMVSSGDECYLNECEGLKSANWPAASPDVTAVGGTKLITAENSRGWSDSVWYEPESEFGEIGTGSGCSSYETKPAWQKDASCSHRASNDVAAVGACESPLSVYDSYEREGWRVDCGTSASAPIMAGVEALSGSTARKLGAEAFYKVGQAGKLFDVTAGHNYSKAEGSCSSYLCEAKTGYDGPTGLGTPDGVIVVPPSATTQAAASITETGATLKGTVNPNEVETKYYFEYGKTTSYGTKTAEVSAGSGTSNVEESKAITGLTAGTTYHFRIVATSTGGTTDGEDKTFATLEHTWSSQEPASPTGSKATFLEDVSCSGASECMATGRFENSSSDWMPLVEHWNGTSWATQEPPAPVTSTTPLELHGISCTSGSACTAVGKFTKAKKYVSYAETWNGTKWTEQELPTPEGAPETILRRVSCLSASSCVAVGTFYASGSAVQPLSETWNGTTWTVETPPKPAGSTAGELTDISCVSAEACTAVGIAYVGAWKPLAETWNGTKWSIQETPEPKEAKSDELHGVSCTSTIACTAIGSFQTGTSSAVPLGERWSGSTWSVSEPPIPSGATEAHFEGVSCTTSTACFAAGHSNGTDPLTIEDWNGTTWTAQEPPRPTKEAVSFELNGVSCVSTICMAVGGYTKSGVPVGFAEYYH